MSPPVHAGELRVPGSTLRYHVEGSGVPALVVGSSIYYPRTFSPALRDVLRLAFVDARHFAVADGSVDAAVISLATYLDDLERLRAAVGFERMVLVGHSHHGNLAVEYARRHPAAVSHLVLIGTPPADVPTIVRMAEEQWERYASRARRAALEEGRQALTGERLAALSPEQAYVARYVADGPKYWYDERYDAAWLWRDVPIDLAVMARYRELFADYRWEWDAERTGIPVLVVMGRHDYTVPHVLWDAVAEPPGLVVDVFDRSGHTPQLEEPARFDRVLLGWLRKGGSQEQHR